MPTAIKQLSTQPAAITQLNLTAAIRTAMANAGFGAMPFDEYTDGSGNNVLIYQLVLDSTKTFGTIYLHVQITTALAVSERLSLDWNSSTNSSSTNTPTRRASLLPVIPKSFLRRSLILNSAW